MIDTDKATSLEPTSLLSTLYEQSDSFQANTDSAKATDYPDAQCSKTALRGVSPIIARYVNKADLRSSVLRRNGEL